VKQWAVIPANAGIQADFDSDASSLSRRKLGSFAKDVVAREPEAGKVKMDPGIRWD